MLTVVVVVHWQFMKIVARLDACSNEIFRNKLPFYATFSVHVSDLFIVMTTHSTSLRRVRSITHMAYF